MTPDTKECPYCGETIKAIAKKCRFCGEFWDETTINTGGGAAVGQNVSAGGDFIGRDKITVGKSLRDEQYEIALHWDGKTRLRGFDLAGRDLSQLNLSQADLKGAILTQAIAWGINLARADLWEANLQGANLQGASLWATVLVGANLQGANLWRANLQGAILWGANLRDANLQDADLWVVGFGGADLQGANLQGANNLRDASLGGAKYNGKTVWPEGFIPPTEAVNVDISKVAHTE
jgi:uncharacterized protein YjbI with pentapeptide repeats